MVAKVISGFPGIGKSILFQHKGTTVLDSDSSLYSWISKGVRNPHFPNNYMERIKSSMNQVDYILVSSHKVVRDALKAEGIEYTLVYPDIELKQEYIGRYISRGSNDAFIDFIYSNWDEFIDEIELEDYPEMIKLKEGEYLADLVSKGLI